MQESPMMMDSWAVQINDKARVLQEARALSKQAIKQKAIKSLLGFNWETTAYIKKQEINSTLFGQKLILSF